MPGLSDYSAANFLNYLTGSLATAGSATPPGCPAVWAALFTTAPTSDAGSGGTEVTGGSYVRQQVAGSLATNNTTASGNPTLHFTPTVPSWIVAGMLIRDATSPSVIPANTTVLSVTSSTVVMSANATGGGVGNGDTITFSAFAAAGTSTGTEPSVLPAQTVTTNAAITFVQATANWGTVTFLGLYDAVSSGNFLAGDFLGNFSWLPFSATSASPSVFTSPAHGYSNSDSVVVTTKYGGTLPTTGGSFAGLLTVANVTTDTFTVGVNTTGTGDGQVRKVTQQSIPSNVQATFAAGSVTITLA